MLIRKERKGHRFIQRREDLDSSLWLPHGGFMSVLVVVVMMLVLVEVSMLVVMVECQLVIMLVCLIFGVSIIMVGRVNTLVLCMVVGLVMVRMDMVMIMAVLVRVCMTVGFTMALIVLMGVVVTMIFTVIVVVLALMLVIMFVVSTVIMIMRSWVRMGECVIVSVVMRRGCTSFVLMMMVHLSSLQMVLLLLLCGLKNKVKATVIAKSLHFLTNY